MREPATAAPFYHLGTTATLLTEVFDVGALCNLLKISTVCVPVPPVAHITPDIYSP